MIGKLTGMAKSFAADERGATAVEYGLIAGGLSIVIATAVGLVGGPLRDVLYGPVASALSSE